MGTFVLANEYCRSALINNTHQTPNAAFLFDMDGVICDNNAYHKSTWLDYAAALGCALTEDDIITKVYGKTNKHILEYVLGRACTKEEVEHHAELKEGLFREQFGPHFKLTLGLEAFLARAHALGIPMALATNATESNLDFTWEKGQLHRYFSAKVHPGLVQHPKPAPDLYLYAAAAVNRLPSGSIVFEDSKTGISAARAAGAKVGYCQHLAKRRTCPLGRYCCYRLYGDNPRTMPGAAFIIPCLAP